MFTVFVSSLCMPYAHTHTYLIGTMKRRALEGEGTNSLIRKKNIVVAMTHPPLQVLVKTAPDLVSYFSWCVLRWLQKYPFILLVIRASDRQYQHLSLFVGWTKRTHYFITNMVVRVVLRRQVPAASLTCWACAQQFEDSGLLEVIKCQLGLPSSFRPSHASEFVSHYKHVGSVLRLPLPSRRIADSMF